jgi:hypothetical protein
MWPTLLTLWHTLSGKAPRKAGPRRRPAGCHPRLEVLEDRAVPVAPGYSTSLCSRVLAVAMRRISPFFLAAFLTLVFGQRTKADFIYSFTTTMPGDNLGSSLSVTLDAIVAPLPSTPLSAANIVSIESTYTSTSFSFLNFTNTNPNQLDGAATVNGLTGDILAPANLFVDGPLLSIFLDFGPLNTPQGFLVGTFFGSDVCTGTWTVEQTGPVVPEPSSLVLAGVGGCILLVGAVRRRYRRQEAPQPTT